MAKSFYDHVFHKVLLENPMLPGPSDNNNAMDQGVQDFSEIQGFAANLDPAAIKTSTFGQIKDNVSKIFDDIDQVNNFAGAKLDQLTNDAPAIIAMSIATDPSKKAAFENLHSELSEFTASIEEVEGKFATLKAKISKFVGDVGQPS
jgi:hypothetical protein